MLPTSSVPPTFSPELEAALRDVLPSTDPIDDPDFSPVDHVNRLFPTEESLGGIDAYVTELKEAMGSLDGEILQTVREQTGAGSSARRDLESGKAAMLELFGKVREIRGKAEASEAMVHEICADIKSLDHAKRHLTLTITALKRLQMLVTAVDQLAVMTRERMYPEAANLLQAVTQLLEHFDAYQGIPKMDSLRDQVAEIRAALRTQIFDDFNHLSSHEGGSHSAQFEVLAGACAAVDALGPDVRREMLSWFSNWQFAPYKHAFQPYGERGSLDQTELRYGWLRRKLKEYAEQFANLFPASWRVSLAITREFCAITHGHLEEILDQSRGSLDAAVLTHALQKTVEFEKEVHAQFGPEMIAEAEADADADAAKACGVGGGPKLLGSISSCFDSYMGIYVALEDKGVDEAVSKLLSDEDWAVARTGRPDSRVFNSSKELFIALKRSFKRGTALRMPNVLYDLHNVWAKHLRSYARRVHEQLPPLVPPADVSASHTCSLELSSQQKVCAVVNTCVYCSDTIGQLEESIGKALADEQFKKSVDLGLVKEEFQSVLTAGMKVLVAALETRIAPSLGVMTRHKWELVEELSEDTSQYMLDIVSAARETMPQLGEALMPLYVRFFCDKFVESFLPRLIGALYRCRRIGEVGAQQMQVDVGTLKATLLELPTLGQANATAIYTRLVTSEIKRAEQILKLVQTPPELLEVTVEELRNEGSTVDLAKILKLKGIAQGEQDKIMEAAYQMSASASEGAKKIKKLFNAT